MKHDEIPYCTSIGLEKSIQDIETYLIENKKGSNNYLFVKMMSETHKFNEATKPLKFYPNFNNNQKHF